LTRFFLRFPFRSHYLFRTKNGATDTDYTYACFATVLIQHKLDTRAADDVYTFNVGWLVG